MFIEVGGKLSFTSGKDTDKDSYYKDEYGYRNLSLSIPVNYVYQFKLPYNISILPYTGFNFKFNLVQEAGEGDKYNDFEWANCFDDDEAYDEGWRRFQFGWNIGCGITYKSLYLGAGYLVDFTKGLSDEYNYKVTTGTFNLTLGYQF